MSLTSSAQSLVALVDHARVAMSGKKSKSFEEEFNEASDLASEGKLHEAFDTCDLLRSKYKLDISWRSSADRHVKRAFLHLLQAEISVSRDHPGNAKHHSQQVWAALQDILVKYPNWPKQAEMAPKLRELRRRADEAGKAWDYVWRDEDRIRDLLRETHNYDKMKKRNARLTANRSPVIRESYSLDE